MKTFSRSRFRRRRTTRAVASAGLCALALLALSAPAGATGDREAGGLKAVSLDELGDTVLTAIASTTNADEALGALGNGLALMEARRRVEANAASSQSAPPGDPNPGSAGSSHRPGEDAAGLGRLQRHRGPAPQYRRRAEDLRPHARRGGDSTSILLTGIALPPPDAPQAVKDVVNNANMIVGRPYVWGGGHGSFYSYGYDCSGSVSFALFGGGMIPEPLTSGALEGWGAPGPGKWITVYANAGHTFAEIAGLRWDTVGDAQGTGPRWHLAPASTSGFVVRHPPGY